MTTTFPAPSVDTPTLQVSAVAPATRFRRKALGIGVIAGAVLTAAGFVATVWETGPGKLDYLDSLVVDPMRSQIAAVLLMFGYLAMLPALLALAAMTRRHSRIAGNVGFGLAVVGALQLPGLLVTDFYDLAIRQTLSPEQAVVTSDAAGNLPFFAVFGGPFVIATCLGMTVMAFGACRAGFFPVAAAPLLVPGFAVNFVLPTGPIQGIAGGLFLAAFLAVVGISALRMRDAEWVTGQRMR